ncbi:MAG: hypothetical protein C4541_08440 [Candidatus Auribacter fodinae]|uniref:Uncharacterized protein n=1 Tax=Candidatus Auribacter fodinae TaxID=2093366 RepID=A0A3A4QWV2_9BACT|nr:MAG: hypothetical protein C4541_08440 [Candidatus Auribacter fodinae]
MLSFLLNCKSALSEYARKMIDFYTNNPLYSILFLAASLPVLILAIYHRRRKRLASQSIINRAHDKSIHDKKVISLDKKPSTSVRVVKKGASGSKKFVLVPYDEWLEFLEYKKRISDNCTEA